MAYTITVTRRAEFPDGRVEPLGTITVTGCGTPALARASRLDRLRAARTYHRTLGGVVEVRIPSWRGEPCTRADCLEWSDPDQPTLDN